MINFLFALVLMVYILLMAYVEVLKHEIYEWIRNRKQKN